MADELFAGFTPTPPPTTPKPPEETPVSSSSSDASSLLNFGGSTAPAGDVPVPATSPASISTPAVSDGQLFAQKADSTAPTSPVVPVPEALLHMISDAEGAPAPDVPVVSEVPASVTSTDPLPVDVPPMTPEIGSGTPPPPADVVDTSHSSETPVIPTTPVPPVTVAKTTDPRLESFIKDDPIYQEMLQTVDAHKVRLSLALRYALLMFGIFLVFAWIVNNRVIMFGFSEFVWLARIRDGLFGVMAGLFSATLWYGSPVWFHNMFFIMMIRIFACVFFLGVLSALYFPIL